MVRPLLIVCRSVVWFAVLLVPSDGRVAGFDGVRRVLCGAVWICGDLWRFVALMQRSVTIFSTSVQSILTSVLCGYPS